MRNESLYRQWQILHLIYSHSQRGISQSELAAEFQVSKRTITRDIQNLSSVSFPIYADKEKYGDNQVYYFMESSYRIPQISFSEDEFATLYLMLKLSHPFESYFNGLFKDTFSKIMAQTPLEYRKFAARLSDIILPETTNVIPYTIENSNNLSVLMENILNQKKVKFQYKSIFSQGIKTHLISPLAIKFFNNNFYLAGFSKKKNLTLIFAINRIFNLEKVDESQDIVKFNPEKFFDESFGITEGKQFKARLRFNKIIAQYVSERSWHANQRIIRQENGDLILELPAKSISEMTKFVLSFKENVEVLEPQELKEEVIQTIIKIAQIYEKKE